MIYTETMFPSMDSNFVQISLPIKLDCWGDPKVLMLDIDRPRPDIYRLAPPSQLSRWPGHYIFLSKTATQNQHEHSKYTQLDIGSKFEK